MALAVVDAIPGFEVCEAKSRENVAASDGEKPQVDHVEEERQPGRERSDDQNRRNDQELQPPDHDRSLVPRSASAAAARVAPECGDSGLRCASGSAGPIAALQWDGVEQLGNDPPRVNIVHGRTGLDDQAMGEGRFRERFDVVGNDVVAARECGEGLTGPI